MPATTLHKQQSHRSYVEEGRPNDGWRLNIRTIQHYTASIFEVIFTSSILPIPAMKRWQGVGQVLWMLSARVQVVGSSKVSFCTMAMWKKTHISIYIYLWYLYIYIGFSPLRIASWCHLPGQAFALLLMSVCFCIYSLCRRCIIQWIEAILLS